MTTNTSPSEASVNILFLCTGNSARSILGEALVNHIGATISDVTNSGAGNVVARGFSAGSTPVGRVNPLALEVLESRGLETGALHSKSWDEFTQTDAPHMDIIITVCDNAAGETCPIWPGHPATAHWGLPDPAALVRECGLASDESHSDALAAFEAIFHILKDRLEQFFGADIAAMDQAERAHILAHLGGPLSH